jgi:hypothetical protein
VVFIFRQDLVVAGEVLVVTGSSVRRSWVIFRQYLVLAGTFWLSSA